MVFCATLTHSPLSYLTEWYTQADLSRLWLLPSFSQQWLQQALLWPFRVVYLHGPRVWGSGGWEGADTADVCAGLSGAPSSFWSADEGRQTQCDRIITNRVTGIAIGALVISTASSLLWCIWAYTHYCLYVKPFSVAIRSLNQNKVNEMQ